jgi:hypothetical protein
VAVGLIAATGLAVLDLTIWPGGPGSQLLWLVAGLLGGSVAVALDDPAATVTGVVPTRRWWRTAIRMLVAVGALVAWGAYVARVTDTVSASWLAAVFVGATLVLAAAGAATALGRARSGEPGSVVASMTVVSVLGLMILPLPRDFAAYDVSGRWTDATALWALLGTAGTAALVWGAADPWRRRLGQRPTGRRLKARQRSEPNWRTS